MASFGFLCTLVDVYDVISQHDMNSLLISWWCSRHLLWGCIKCNIGGGCSFLWSDVRTYIIDCQAVTDYCIVGGQWNLLYDCYQQVMFVLHYVGHVWVMRMVCYKEFVGGDARTFWGCEEYIAGVHEFMFRIVLDVNNQGGPFYQLWANMHSDGLDTDRAVLQDG